MQIVDFLTLDAVAVRSGPCSSRQALAALADMAAPAVGRSADGLFEGLMDREQIGSTGLGSGVAAPHVRRPLIRRVTGAFLRLEAPTPFNALDGRPVDLFFALFAPAGASAEHLRALAVVSRLLRRAEVRQRLRQAHTPASLFTLLAQPIEAYAA